MSYKSLNVEGGGQDNHHSARNRFLKSTAASELRLDIPVPASSDESDGEGAANDERRSLTASSTGAQSHVPLSIFLCLFGLRVTPHQNGNRCNALCGLLIVLFSFGVLMQVVINFVCLVFDSGHCPYGANNMSVLHSNEKSVLFAVTVYQFLAPLITYAAAVWCVHKAVFVDDVLHPSLMRTLVTRDNWKQMNRKIAFSVFIVMLWFGVACYMTYDLISEKAKEDSIVLGITDGFTLVVLTISLLANHAVMLMFNAIIDGLIACVDQMRQHILQSGQHNINEAIIVFTDLSKVIRATSKVFGVWFLLQWPIYSLMIVGNGPLIQAIFSFPAYPIWTKPSLSFLTAINHNLFIFPVIVAASLDARCKEMIREINDMVSSEWPAGHVLKDRSQLDLFLSHAERSDLAFMAGPIPIRMAHVVLTLAFSSIVGAVNIIYPNY